MMTITHNFLKATRKKTPILQTDMDFLLRHAQGTGAVWKCEHGQRPPSLMFICKYMLVHGVTLEELFPKQFSQAQQELVEDIPVLQKEIREIRVYNYTLERIDALSEAKSRIASQIVEDYRAHSISIFLNSTGFGYAVFKSQKELLDVGVERLRTFDAKKVFKRIKELIDFYEPKEIIYRENDPHFKKLSKRATAITRKVKRYADKIETPVIGITMTQITKTFTCFGITTKHERAEKICEWFPECAYRQIRERTLTTFAGEHEPVFDAITQGVAAHFLDNEDKSA